MTQPIGMNPQDAATVNSQTGSISRQFVLLQEQVGRFQAWLAGHDLKLAPYSFTSNDEATIKSAISGLDTSLSAVDRTFIDRLTGLY